MSAVRCPLSSIGQVALRARDIQPTGGVANAKHGSANELWALLDAKPPKWKSAKQTRAYLLLLLVGGIHLMDFHFKSPIRPARSKLVGQRHSRQMWLRSIIVLFGLAPLLGEQHLTRSHVMQPFT